METLFYKGKPISEMGQIQLIEIIVEQDKEILNLQEENKEMLKKILNGEQV